MFDQEFIPREQESFDVSDRAEWSGWRKRPSPMTRAGNWCLLAAIVVFLVAMAGIALGAK